MPRRRVLIIANPAAGRAASSRRQLNRVIAALERRGCGVTLRRASAVQGDVERLAREAEAEFEVIVAAGGDGTLNAVVNGTAAARVIALLPFGTANLLARELGLPRDPEQLAELIANGPERPIWPGRINGRLFLMMASSGFDAEIVAAINPWLKRHCGRLAFVWAIIVCLWRYRPARLVVRANHEADNGIEHVAATVIAARGRHYAGPYVIAPQASLSEPAIDLVLFHRSGRLAALRYLAALLRGRLPSRSDVSILRARQSSLAAAEPTPIQADGEIVGCVPASLAIAEQPLRFICP